ncbi:MAG: long-chain fatty acid--CoA ligase [Planctomycetia bacterium]|nr:long-chain fatty acid--CoA ligase [Planctomycetia bacterium]
MPIGFLLDAFAAHREADAIVWRDRAFSYGWLEEHIADWRDQLAAEAIPPGAVVAIEADFSPAAVALFLALIEHGAILVPLTESVAQQRDEFLDIAEVEFTIALDRADAATFARRPVAAAHEFYVRLRALAHPGLVLFSSGSTGKSKAAVHDVVGILEKFRVPRKRMRTISFLLYDHIGGINTMLYTLANAGCLVTVADRTPDGVLGAVARHKVELLPTSPTFLNMLLFSEAYTRHDTSSLHTITYGTEPMPESTLRRLHELFPDKQLVQTYGLSEVGILRSKSKSSDSLWVKIGGEGFETRVVDRILQIKARSSMLGYLNAASPFTSDGWFVTGDEVEVDGEYVRILGRKSELINVGGQKVFPAEVEGVIQEMPGVADATVYGERNAITGQIVCAKVTLDASEDTATFPRRLKQHCRGRLALFKVPVKVDVVAAPQHGARFKKMRNAEQTAAAPAPRAGEEAADGR